MQVEAITTSKKPNLILNVDGTIGAIFVDILRNSGNNFFANFVYNNNN